MNPLTLVNELESLLEQLDLDLDSRSRISSIIHQLKTHGATDSKTGNEEGR
ncbi:hypothetical protein [Aeromonas caviae]|uniref:hypothetical protein n=1 Tax=Aeromonas caviae TaxID=648 RepID=UPI0031200BAC